MDTATIIAALTEEIERLTLVRNILKGHGANSPAPVSKPKHKKRFLSPEARERIAAAQRRRWAAQKKAAK